MFTFAAKSNRPRLQNFAIKHLSIGRLAVKASKCRAAQSSYGVTARPLSEPLLVDHSVISKGRLDPFECLPTLDSECSVEPWVRSNVVESVALAEFQFIECASAIP